MANGGVSRVFRLRWLGAVLLTGAAAIAVFAFILKGPAATSSQKNLVVISIDTLRADHLSSYGYERRTTPFIDALAHEGALFERAVTPASWTLPAHVSMLSGLYPHTHGVQRSERQGIRDNTNLLAEVLKEKDYFTVGITGGGFVARRYGFNRGFDVYKEPKHYAPKNERNNNLGFAVAQAKESLSNGPSDKPFFLFLHTYDVHCPYSPPPAFRGKFEDPDAEAIEPNRCGESFYNKRRLSQGHARFLIDRYDESIQAADAELESLFAYLRSRPDYDRTVIVITSDHGEEFLEHGQIGHQRSVHREVLFVPFIVREPGAAPIRVSDHVSLIDLFPTALELLGIETTAEVDGLSHGAVIRGLEPAKKFRDFEFSETQRGKSRLYSRIGNRSHVIIDDESKSVKFYDLSEDPNETTDLAAVKPDWFRRKHQELTQFVISRKSAPSAEIRDNSEAERKKLESLGYL